MTKKEKTKKPNKKVTPLMKQYGDIKAKYPDAILLFRVGDFYETFGADAVTASRVLGIILTKRNNGGSDIELAGFPHHSMDLYLPRLVRAGFRVAVCEQLEKPSKEKKIVKRGVTELVTPGVTTSDKILDHKTNNFLAALSFGKKEQVGVSFLDLSTGELMVAEGNISFVDKLLQSFQPSEIIFSKNYANYFSETFGTRFYTYPLDEWIFTQDFTQEQLLNHFKVKSLKGFGVDDLSLAHQAAGASLHYLATTENNNIKHITRISRIQEDRYVWLDRFTIRNLELIYSPHETGVPLINILDKTISPMGARLLKKWVVLPLCVPTAIQSRLDTVEYFTKETEFREVIANGIQQIGDLERLISRVPLGKINPREIIQLSKASLAIGPIKEALVDAKSKVLTSLGAQLDPCPELIQTIQKYLQPEPPVNLNKGGVMADELDDELDELRNIVKNGKNLLLEIQQTEAKRTGIDNLKIGFNNVFGYYLEVTNKYKNKGLIPDDWTRKQTLTNAERYITEELKKLEAKILGAEEKILTIEERLFEELVIKLADFIPPIQKNSSSIARLDCLLAFANVAIRNNYCKPTVDDSFVVDIKAGRHPVIEQHLELGDAYVPNDVFLDNDEQQLMMITGPNMAGKSALLRQTALICLMAQMGSFVPAESARIGLIDKVFTRVGATDNISSGESTFMVEMNETASIMNNISDRSLILMDEIGRGTSTYDGISIAWSITEYLHNNGQFRPKTLFATHYHELNELANKFERIKNWSIATKELDHKVIFLRKLVPGGSNHSFGIYVAKMAGMPRSVVERAQYILSQLEQKSIQTEGDSSDVPTTKNKKGAIKKQLENISASPLQLSIFESTDPALVKLKETLAGLDLNGMTPIECMMKLSELKGML